jgi:hypothetical protein
MLAFPLRAWLIAQTRIPHVETVSTVFKMAVASVLGQDHTEPLVTGLSNKKELLLGLDIQ